MKAASARRRLLALATLALAPLLLSLSLWVSQDHRGFLAVAFSLVVVAFFAYLGLRSLPSALAGNSESAESARQELARTRDEAHAAVTAMGGATAGLVRGNRGLAERTEGQTSAIEQAAATIEELACGVNGNTNTARETQRVANLAHEATDKGIHAATMLIAHMETIREATARVADIVGVIDAIAFQTSLLALNASVEAARAGEQGRGFAVVAGEVRNLSLRCADSARQIKELVGSASDQVHASTDVVDEVAEAMAAINARVAEVNQLMNAIVAAGAGRSAGVAQVGRTITQMERASQQNAAHQQYVECGRIVAGSGFLDRLRVRRRGGPWGEHAAWVRAGRIARRLQLIRRWTLDRQDRAVRKEPRLRWRRHPIRLDD